MQEMKIDDISRLDVAETARRITCFLSSLVTGKGL